MIVIKIELHSATTREVTLLHTGVIYNDGTGTKTRGNYVVKLGKKGASLAQVMAYPSKVWKSGTIYLFPRKRWGAWNLLFTGIWNIVMAETRAERFDRE